MPSSKPDNLAAIRRKYSVPARRGDAVEIQGRGGVITGVCGDCVRVKLLGMHRGIPFHPNEITYLGEAR